MAQGAPTAPSNSSSNLSNLFPELLLGLLGHTGGAFVAATIEGSDPSSPENSFPTLSPAVDWVTVPERYLLNEVMSTPIVLTHGFIPHHITPRREQLNGLVKLGHYFAYIEAFIFEHSSSPSLSHSAYATALATGLDELLDVYRSYILKIEQRLTFKNKATTPPPPPPLLALRQFLADFEVLLPEASSIVSQVKSQGLKGARIIELLDRRAQGGWPPIESCCQRLLWHCYRVLFKQIESWMVYGELVDPTREFFITAQEEKEQRSTMDSFIINTDALPLPAIPAHIAQGVLFVGRSVRLLTGHLHDHSGRHNHYHNNNNHADVSQHPFLTTFQQTLRQLSDADVLHIPSFHFAVECAQHNVASLLWSELRERCNLEKELECLQGYFLLERGDVVQQLLQDAQESGLLASAPDAYWESADADWSDAFTQAILACTPPPQHAQHGKSIAHDIEPSRVFFLRWFPTTATLPAWHPSNDPSLHVPSYDLWDGLCLECRPQWPLELLLPTVIIRQYSALWQYMFRLRRVHMDLETAWGSLSSALRRLHRPSRRHRSPQHNAHPHPPTHHHHQLSHLRQRMSHFVSNLALYLRVDVLESEISTLKRKISASKDFSEANTAHQAFIEAVTSQACLDVRQLMHAVESIFALCRRLCEMVERLGTCEAEEVGALATAFALKSNVVFQLLQSDALQKGARATVVRQLVVRLNFNRFCEEESIRAMHAMMMTTGSGGTDGTE